MVDVMRKWAWLLLTGCFFNASAAVYGIDTENFEEVYGQYSTNDNISGVVVTTSNITPNAGLVDVTPILVSYSFSDGVQTLDQTNSTILFFTLAVNGSNQVTESGITIWKAPVTTMIGGVVEGMDIYFNVQSHTIQGFKDGVCQNTSGPGGTCGESHGASTNSGVYSFYDPIFSNGFDF